MASFNVSILFKTPPEILNTPIQLKTFHFTSIYMQGNDAALKEKLTDVAVTVSESAMKRLLEKIKK